MSAHTHRDKCRTAIPRVALIVETTRAYGRRILQGVSEYVCENGPWLMHAEPRALFDPAPSWLKTWGGDGIIARVVDERSATIIKNAGIPVVNLKASAHTCLGRPPITTDQAAIGRLAAEHFLERGFKRFAFIGIPGYEWSDGRFEGFQEAVRRRGCSCEQYPRSQKVLARYRDGSLAEEIDRITAWLARLPRPLGVMAADDFLGLELLNGCHYAGISVPEEVAVVGVDDEATICKLNYPQLSSIMPDNVRMGREAAALLDRLMRGEPPPAGQLRIPPRGIVTRQSSDVMAIDDPTVARAMRFIREHAGEGINVGDVLRHVVVAPSTLQRRFRKTLNRSVYDVILSARISRVKELLAETDLPLRAVASRAGFRHVEHMSAVFRARTGRTPINYRKQYSRGAQKLAPLS